MILDILNEILNKAYLDCGYEFKANVLKSNRPDLCDYQSDDLFKLAKLFHKSPIVIGNEIVDKINSYEDFSKYFKEVTLVNPGFINITISDFLINNLLNEMINNEDFNIKKDSSELYFLDYGGPNVAKPLHVGHLRTAIIGESIKRILKYKGHKVISDVHLGDYGLQIGQVIYGVLNDKKSLDEITLEYLEETYPKMSKLCKEDSDILEKCASITKELQDGNLEYKKIWKKICEVSVNDIKRIYRYLDVSFDLYNGESDAYQYIPKLTEILEEKKLLKNSDNAKIIEVNEENDLKEYPPLIYQKSNGAYLYGTTDLAAIYERVTKYSPQHILYIVDLRQKLHFEQVFRAIKKSNITTAELKHLGYGTVNGSDGRPFKTRSGDTLKLDSLFKEVKNTFLNIKEENKNLKEADLDIIVNAIIKFADLQNNYEKDYIFDLNKFSNVVGKTGPYILYTYLRINKIINKESINISSLNNIIYNEYDRDLRLKLLDLPIIFEMSFNERKPNYIAEFIYDVCVLGNIFYQNNHITGLEESQKQQWLTLLSLTNKILKEMLNLLAIQIPSEM